MSLRTASEFPKTAASDPCLPVATFLSNRLRDSGNFLRLPPVTFYAYLRQDNRRQISETTKTSGCTLREDMMTLHVQVGLGILAILTLLIASASTVWSI